MGNYIENDMAYKLKTREKTNEEYQSGLCAFCKENRHMSTENGVYLEDKDTGMLFIPNKYPSFPEYNMGVVVEFYDCKKGLQDYTLDDYLIIYEFTKKSVSRYKELYPEDKEIFVLKQVGREAGGSMEHGHLQIFGSEIEKLNHKKIQDKLQNGRVIYKNQNLKINYNTIPINELDEYILKYTEETDIKLVMEKLKIITDYNLQSNLNISYSFHKYGDYFYIKVKKRIIPTTLLLHYDLPIRNTINESEIAYLYAILSD